MAKWGTFVWGDSTKWGHAVADFPHRTSLTIEIAGVNRTASISPATILIEEMATKRDSQASFVIKDGGAMDLAELDAIVIAGWEQQYEFAGYVWKLEELSRGIQLDYRVDCVDYGWYLEHPEALVGGAYTSQSDQSIIQDFMPTCCPDLDCTTYVEVVKANIVNVEFDRKTPRKALELLAQISGAEWYVDYGPGPTGKKAYLHYFDPGTNSAPFSLSDSPDFANSFPYENLSEIKEALQANKVVIVGQGDIVVTRTRGSESDYGWWLTTKLVDSNITTTAQAETLGDQLLEELAAAPTYECTTRYQGLQPGQDVTLVNSTRSINGSFMIMGVTTRFDGGGLANHRIKMGRYLPSFSDILARSTREATQFIHRDHDHSGGAEGPKIDPGDLDPTLPVSLPYAVPAIVLDTVAAEGSADNVIRSDSTIVAFDATVPNTIEPDDVAATGSIDYAARRDHEHAIVCATAVSVASANAEGAATSFARSNHTHQGLHSIQKAAAGALYGDVTLSEGANISLAQVGQDIAIAASGVTLLAFKTISCPAGTNPVADATDDTLTLTNGANISITGDQAADSVTIAVTGVTLLAFKTISCPAGTSPVADAVDDTLTLAAGTNITITGNAAADSVTVGLTTDRLDSVDGVSNAGGDIDLIAGTGIAITPNDGANTITIGTTGVSLLAFKTINCPAGTDPVADATDDTLNLAVGTNITITGTAASDTVTIGLTTDRLDSVDGVSNAGGDIDLIADTGITVTPDDGANTITIGTTATLVAFSQVYCPDNLATLVADLKHDMLNFASGDGISITGTVATDTIAIGLDSLAFAFKNITTDGVAIIADQIGDTASILGGNAITTSGAADTITVDFDYTVTASSVADTVVLRSSGRHIDCGHYWIDGTVVIDSNYDMVNMNSCNLIAHGGYGLPWVRVPTSRGTKRLTAIESPAFLFQDVADEIDPLLKEVGEGEIWVAPLFRAVEGTTPEWQKLSQREPDKWLILTQRPGYAGIRFQEAPPASEEQKPESPYWEVEDIEEDQKKCNGCKTLRQ